MKNKIIVIVISLLLIIFTIVVSKQAEDKYRYHEHIELKQAGVEVFDYKNIDYSVYGSLNITRENIKTHLPIIELEVQDAIPGVNPLDASLASGSFKLFNEDGKLEVESLTNLRYRGNSSLRFDKKGYLIKLKNEDGSNNDQELLNMSKESEWALHGPYLDKTLMRNYMWYNIAGEILDYSPNVRYVEVFLNGKYEGLYLLTEKITVSKYGRLHIAKSKKDSKSTSFLLEMTDADDVTSNGLSNLTSKSLIMNKDTVFQIKYPGVNRITKDQYEYITSYINDFEKTLYSYDYDNKKAGYDAYIDVNNFVDYFILSEVTMNYDNGNRSTYVYKDNKGKLKLSIWDMNNIFDNFFLHTDTSVFYMKDKLWFSMLLKDKKFTDKAIKRYRELRNTVLSDEYLNSYIDDTVNYLGTAIIRNYSRWGDSFLDEKSFYKDKERNIYSYEEAISQYKTVMKERLEWLDENIDTLRQFSHESNIKNQNP